MTLKWKPLHEDASLEKPNTGDVGYDLKSMETKTFVWGEMAILPTGISIEPPDGYYGRIGDERSSMAKNGFIVSAGVIDPSYRGDIGVNVRYMPSLNILELLKVAIATHISKLGVLLPNLIPSYTIEKGDKIAQLILSPYLVDDIELATLSKTKRGSKGYGSTGK